MMGSTPGWLPVFLPSQAFDYKITSFSYECLLLVLEGNQDAILEIEEQSFTINPLLMSACC
jgi:hypothetical protein